MRTPHPFRDTCNLVVYGLGAPTLKVSPKENATHFALYVTITSRLRSPSRSFPSASNLRKPVVSFATLLCFLCGDWQWRFLLGRGQSHSHIVRDDRLFACLRVFSISFWPYLWALRIRFIDDNNNNSQVKPYLCRRRGSQKMYIINIK